MTNEELLARESIRHTMARYIMAGDRLQTEDFIAVFTEDAILETDDVPEQDALRYVGRQAIHDWIKRWRDRPRKDGKPVHDASFVRHHLSTSLIEFVDGETARARTYWTAYTDIGPDHGGYYLDLFRRTGDCWLIAHRRVRMDWRSPDSLMLGAVARSS